MGNDSGAVSRVKLLLKPEEIGKKYFCCECKMDKLERGAI